MAVETHSDMGTDAVISITVNGRGYSVVAEHRTLLSDFLRHKLQLTGTHVGCEQGVCGACSVLIDGELSRSCLVLAISVDGKSIQTVEGLSPGKGLHPIQAAFHEKHGLQCGFCTPGLLMTTASLLEHNPDPTEQEVREYLSGNVCRCTGYAGVVDSVLEAAKKLRVVQAGCSSDPAN